MKEIVSILSIDASQKVCSVAIHQNGSLVANHTLFTDRTASSLLTPLIRQILENTNLKPIDLSAVSVAMGPGSFTGLRIAISTAKGLCLAIDKPLIGVNTLEAMALQITPLYPKDYLYCPMLDARRMEVYCAVYDSNLHILQNTEAKIIDENSFSELLATKSVVFFGDGASKCKDILSKNKNVIILENQIQPSANTVGELAINKFEKGIFENLVSFEPYYLKDFVGNLGN